MCDNDFNFRVLYSYMYITYSTCMIHTYLYLRVDINHNVCSVNYPYYLV